MLLRRMNSSTTGSTDKRCVADGLWPFRARRSGIGRPSALLLSGQIPLLSDYARHDHKLNTSA